MLSHSDSDPIQKRRLFGNVKHYRQLHEFALLRLMPVQLPH